MNKAARIKEEMRIETRDEKQQNKINQICRCHRLLTESRNNVEHQMKPIK